MRVFMILVATAGLAGVADAEEWRQTFPVTGRPRVTVRSNDASVVVRGADTHEIDALVETKGYKIGPGDVQVIERHTADSLDLEVRIPATPFHFGFSSRSVRIELQVPKDLKLNVHTGDGSVQASDLSGSIAIESGDGSLAGESMSGEVRLHTKDGSIRGSGLVGNVDADTGDGSVRLAGRFDRLRVSSGDGSIHADAEAGSKVATDWVLRSGDGSIRLTVPGDVAANVEATTGDGRIESDLPLLVQGSIGGHSLRGQFNGGGPLLSLRTGDGSIHLHRN